MMRVAVDLDDVLADLISCVISVHAEMNGVRLQREQVVDWDVFPPAVHDAVRAKGWYGRLQPLPGAAAFMAWLRERHDPHIVTYRSEAARAITTQWLEQHLAGLYKELHLAGGPKLAVCLELDVDLIIDDSPRHLPAVCSAMRIPGILIDSPMNAHLSETDLIRRARDLDQARELVLHFEQRLSCRQDVMPAAESGDEG
jgi:5'(3')-deoxyribonucleotidase